MNLHILIPRFEWGTLKSNRHIYRRGKYGPKFRTRRKGCAVVQLGKGYITRHIYGLRFWHYREDGSCWHLGLSFWNGKQHGVAS